MEMFLRWIAPVGLALLTALTTFVIGSTVFGPNRTELVDGVIFAASTLAAIGAHAGAHVATARRHGVDAYGPYFVPTFNLSGTAGVYVRLRWPIVDRTALLQIFAAGPIAGFVASSAFFVTGVMLSSLVAVPADAIFLGDSLLTYAVQHAVFPARAPGQDIALHPIGMAGYFGLLFNVWHLIPAGRLDAGRIVYAIWGYRPFVVTSWFTVGLLLVFAAFSPAWLGFAVFAALTMIRVSRQHPSDPPGQPARASPGRLGFLLVILVLTFVPVPVRLQP